MFKLKLSTFSINKWVELKWLAGKLMVVNIDVNDETQIEMSCLLWCIFTLNLSILPQILRHVNLF